MLVPSLDRPLVPRLLLAASLLAGCQQELTCDDGTEFILSGSTTRYATHVSLLSEKGVVVGVRGQNDRSLSFVLRAPAGTDFLGSATLDVATLDGGLTYLECTAQLTPENCTPTSPQAVEYVAHAGTVSIEIKDDVVQAKLDLRDVRRASGSPGDTQGCFRVPDSRTAAAGAAGASAAQ